MLTQSLLSHTPKLHTTKSSTKTSKRNYSRRGGNVYLVEGKRTPFGKFGGSLKDITPVDLSVIAVNSLLVSTKVAPSKVDHYIFANVIPSTTDTIYGARHIALKSGAPNSTPGYTVNRLCGSGIQAISDAKNMIERGDADCVVAVGAENMTMTPHLLYGSRFGTRFGALKTVDMLFDSLTDSFCEMPMALTAEKLAQQFEITREECDEYAFRSHEKASNAYKEGLLQGEIIPVELKRDTIDRDEHVRSDATLEGMTKLRPSFVKEGTVTAANASGIVDGAASVLVCSERFVQENNLTPLAVIDETVSVGVDPEIMGYGPVEAINGLLNKTRLELSDIDLFEINEAFAPQVLACAKALKLNTKKLNIWGGAVSIGHPLGASGVRITNTLARQMKHSGKSLGISSACIGGGQGIAMLIRSV